MARLTSAQRGRLPSREFAGPDRSYPIENRSHAANAKARVADKSPALKARVDRAVAKKYPGMGKGTPVGFGSLRHRNKPINAPNSLAGRRAASHGKAYQD